MNGYTIRVFFVQGVVLFFCLILFGCGEPQVDRYTLHEGEMLGEMSATETLNSILDEYFPEDRPNDLVDNDGEPVLAPWTRVLEDEVVDQLIVISDDQIIFPISMQPELSHIGLMDVIVSAHPEYPFLRRVIFITETDDQIIFDTAHAEITDFMLGGYYNIDEDIEGPDGGVDDVGGPSDLRQYHQESNSSGLGRMNPLTGAENKESTSLLLKLEVKTSNPTITAHRKFEMDVSFGGAASMCNDFRDARQGVVRGWFSDREVNDAILTLAWALKWAGSTTQCRGYNDPLLWGDSTETMEECGGSVEMYEWGVRTDINNRFSAINRNYFVPRQPFRDASTGFVSYVGTLGSEERALYNTLSWTQRNNAGNRVALNHYVRLSEQRYTDRRIRENRTRVLDSYRELARERGYNSSRHEVTVRLGRTPSDLDRDTANLMRMVWLLEDTHGYDDLHWVQMAPVVAQQQCQGVANKFAFGAGVRATLDHEAKVEVELKDGISSSREEEIEWYKRAISRTWITWIGWVPLVLTIELGWKSEVKTFIGGYTKYTVEYPKKQAVLDFYHGLDYDSSRTQRTEWHTLREFNGTENRLAFFDPHPDFPNGEAQASTEAGLTATFEFSTGPQLMLKFYGLVGIGMKLAAYLDAALGAGMQLSGRGVQPVCRAEVKAGIKFQGVGEVTVPGCSAPACKLADAAITLYDTCEPQPGGTLCPYWPIPICSSNNAGGASRGGSQLVNCENCVTEMPASESFPEGVNDVPGMYELDALFLQRGGKKIVPVRVEGIANCDEVADRYPDKFTRERGCPELLWYADFKECDPEGWADKVALIPNFDQFRVQFKEDAKPGDILRVIRQAVRASDMNEEGQRCAASGNMNFHLGVIDSNGNMQYGSTPIAKGAHNTGDFHITDEHLQTNYVSPDEQYWPTSPDDETFGENVDHDPPEGW